MTNQDMVEEFHDKFRVVQGRKGRILPEREQILRARLIIEEAAEVVAALQKGDYVNLAKELADLLYVTYGTAVAAGIPLDDVFREVHRSNMTKTPAKDAGGKVQKGENYEPPAVEAVLAGEAIRG